MRMAPGLLTMARSAAVRLSTPQVRFVGAQVRATYRLYEFTLGAYINMKSGRVARTPPT